MVAEEEMGGEGCRADELPTGTVELRGTVTVGTKSGHITRVMTRAAL